MDASLTPFLKVAFVVRRSFDFCRAGGTKRGSGEISKYIKTVDKGFQKQEI